MEFTQENMMKSVNQMKIVLSLVLTTSLYTLSTYGLKCDEVELFDEANTNSLEIGKVVEKLELQQVSHSKNLSQLLRSNAPHFWSWAKSIKAKSDHFAKTIIGFNGIIMGDSHLGNMHPTMDTRLKKLIWKNVDLDDAGVGSYAFDFLHFVLSVKVVNKDIHVRDMVDSYIAGLNGKDFKPAKSIRKLTKLSNDEYEEIRIEYVKRKTKDGKIKLKPDEIVAFDAEKAGTTRDQLQKIIKSNFGEATEILDLAMILKLRGGSVGMRRIWALLLIDSKQHIYEIKELGESGLENYDGQEPLELNFAQNRTYFGYTEKELPLVDFGNSHFIIREKKLTLFDVPSKFEDKEDEAFLEDLGNWGSYLLGQWHSGQTNSQAYAVAINNNQDGFLLFIKQLRKDYLKILTGVYYDQD